MGAEAWVALAAMLVASLSGTVGTVAYVAYRFGKFEGTLDNGINSRLTELTTSVHGLFEKWDTLPCGERGVFLAELERRVEALE